MNILVQGNWIWTMFAFAQHWFYCVSKAKEKRRGLWALHKRYAKQKFFLIESTKDGELFASCCWRKFFFCIWNYFWKFAQEERLGKFLSVFLASVLHQSWAVLQQHFQLNVCFWHKVSLSIWSRAAWLRLMKQELNWKFCLLVSGVSLNFYILIRD